MQNAPKNPLIKKERVGNEPFYECGFAKHWYKTCHARNRVTANYKRYRESKEQKSHFMNDEGNDADVNLTIADLVARRTLLSQWMHSILTDLLYLFYFPKILVKA